MSKISRESVELPDYEAQRSSLLDQAAAHATDEASSSVLRGTGILRVDVIEYPFNVTSGTTVQELPPKSLTSFLVDYNPNYHDVIEAVREHLEDASAVDLKRLEFGGIRMTGKGPQIGESIWTRIGSKLDRIEVILDVPKAKRAQMHRVCAIALTIVFCILACLFLTLFTVLGLSIAGRI